MTRLTDLRLSPTRLLWIALPYVLFAALAWYEFSTILALNQGKFTYSLDDPYIHLALAQRIAHGSYGINPGESAAPSSSILWPFLLVPFAGAPFFELVPIAYNLLIALATIYVYTQVGKYLLPMPESPPSATRDFKITAITIPLILATNLVGLAYTGMEHTLQVFLCAVVVLGVIRMLAEQAVPGWLVAALVITPLVRYEALAVTLPALALMFLCHRWKAFALALGSTAASLGAFSIFLVTQGIGWLPTSVLAKVSFAGYRPTQNFIIDHIRFNLELPQGQVLAGMMLALVLLAVARRRAPWTERALGFLAAGGGLAHLAAGQFGWMDRYEVYIIAATLLYLLYLGRGLLGWLFEHLGALTTAALLLGLSTLVGQPYYADIERTPGAAANIYEQQYQMHRFVVDYLKAPVAVNDLGWVAFGNPNYVLDLWGLASPQALEARTHAGIWQVDWMARMVAQHNIRLVMIYASPGWFPAQPSAWTAVARLHLGHPQVSAGDDTVTFFVPDPAQADSVRAMLRAFAPTLPPGVDLTFIPY